MADATDMGLLSKFRAGYQRARAEVWGRALEELRTAPPSLRGMRLYTALYDRRWSILLTLLAIPGLAIFLSGYGRENGSWIVALAITYGLIGFFALFAYIGPDEPGPPPVGGP